jgi:3-hydroxyisobutyrate dehydrogenase-like beta-hydroxyacid dehydrogenase
MARPWEQKTLVIDENSRKANLIKLSGNFLITSIIDSTGETVALTRKSGIDPHRVLEILTGTLFYGPIFKTYGGLIADEHYGPADFKMILV